MSAPIARGQSDGELLVNHLGGTITLKASATETDGVSTIFEIVIAPGEGPYLHVHPGHDEFLYALEGSLRIRLGDEVLTAPAGTFVFIPKGSPHTWQNAGDVPARVLAGFTPGAAGMESFFRESAAAAGQLSAGEVFRGIGSGGEMEILGPPLSESHS